MPTNMTMYFFMFFFIIFMVITFDVKQLYNTYTGDN